MCEVVLRYKMAESSISQQVTITNSTERVCFSSLHTPTHHFRDRIEALSYEEGQHHWGPTANEGQGPASAFVPLLAPPREFGDTWEV